MPMTMQGTIETRKSKSGNDYKVLVLKLTPTCSKLVFLSEAELELLASKGIK